ncbi:T9SS type A sorting domain-containing protein [Ekhidna sp. To15]|uniref:T9SS type A sorting domain-containing protein n=1 Tax=Ekhidna sp. To15 TaxID=3395267 RepID=UPI003F522D17
MSKRISIRIIPLTLLLLAGLVAYPQLSNQGNATNYAGGTIAGGSYTSEFTTSQLSGIPKSENFGFYLSLSAFNMESGTITVRARSGGNVISENTSGVLLRIKNSGRYDTLDILSSNSGEFSFNPVFLGNYLINIDSDQDKYVATYYGDAFQWEEADVLELAGDTTTRIIMTVVPPELGPNDGDGNVSGTIEEDFEEDGGRIDARRRASKRKCGLRRKRSGGRTGQDADEFELIAYGETNNNGEFEYGFLPEGTYRFFVEYPGIPLDQSSFVEFDVGEAGVSDNSFVLAALVTETGITIELVLGITSEFFTEFSIYPNPTVDIIHIDYDKIISEKMTMDLIDMNGKIIFSQEIKRSENGRLQIDIGEYLNGQYLLRFIDTEKSKTALTFRVIKR